MSNWIFNILRGQASAFQCAIPICLSVAFTKCFLPAGWLTKDRKYTVHRLGSAKHNVKWNTENTLREGAACASAWSRNRRAATHQEHNICLLVKCSCHADPLALPSRQINTLEISRRETIRLGKKTSSEYSYSLFYGLFIGDYSGQRNIRNFSEVWACNVSLWCFRRHFGVLLFMPVPV